MRNADPRAYGTGGIWPLQHVGYKDKGWEIRTRSAMLAYRINGRLVGVGDVGTWLEEKGSRGDVVGGNLWDEVLGQRDNAAWAFAWPSVLIVAGGEEIHEGEMVPTPPVLERPPVATGGTANPAQPVEFRQPAPRPPRRIRGVLKALPIGANVRPDGRFVPKHVIIPHIDGAAGKDPNAPVPPPPPGGGGDTLFLGIGASATAQGFGGPGVGPGSGFAQFIGVRTNFSSGSANAGARFNTPREGGRQLIVGRR